MDYGGSIPNYTAALPKEYQDASHGINKLTGLPKLFRGIVLGPSGSGKSNLVIDFIKRSPNVYTHLHLIARQPEQPLYQYLKDKLGAFCSVYGEDNVPSVDSIKKDGLQLVIFDDWSNDQRWCSAHVVPFFIRGRHRGLTTLFLAHAFHAGTPKMVRLNCEVLMILRSPSKADLKSVLRDMPISGMDDAHLWSLYSQTTKNRGQMLLINQVSQQIRYNWNKVLYDGTKKEDEY
jgi:hypothetical protein